MFAMTPSKLSGLNELQHRPHSKSTSHRIVARPLSRVLRRAARVFSFLRVLDFAVLHR